MLQIAVIGAGVFGKNHIRIYRELPGVHLAAVVDPAVTLEDTPVFASVDELLASGIPIDCASVCVPTVAHAQVASQLLRAGIDCLIEKPFAASLAEADQVLALAGQYGRIVQIGHLERFNPAVTATMPILTKPMFFESHRLSVFTPRSLDVDVVLDLMIHDLDIVLTMVNAPVTEVRAVGLPVLSPKVDIANVRLEFATGCVANFTASRVSTERVRKLRYFQPRQYVSLDFARQDLLVIDVADPAAAIAAFTQGAGLQHPSAGLSLRKLPVENGEPLKLEIESFLTSVQTRQEPRVTGQQGRAALELALEINQMIAQHAERAGLL
ncbi:Gfo/Idh/MocA family oxidoreductase [Terriglobus albidus]|uniref:Gfo/Idh/MocA family oxidoreductase n=1 Tax=Terriglobus albidus TaxID=1592106 RepID=A0A5B9E582_9BACT|nr:Gfo/Idh/MocA family oxidoreductase [Terriglobus albidus]QEE27158.1 Gfo/Idh/MocA family oxidoreductase [Terriglobus albidus]